MNQTKVSIHPVLVTPPRVLPPLIIPVGRVLAKGDLAVKKNIWAGSHASCAQRDVECFQWSLSLRMRWEEGGWLKDAWWEPSLDDLLLHPFGWHPNEGSQKRKGHWDDVSFQSHRPTAVCQKWLTFKISSRRKETMRRDERGETESSFDMME